MGDLDSLKFKSQQNESETFRNHSELRIFVHLFRATAVQKIAVRWLGGLGGSQQDLDAVVRLGSNIPIGWWTEGVETTFWWVWLKIMVPMTQKNDHV